MDAPKKRRFRFGLRTLLGVVALVGFGLYFRPGQVNPGDVPIGATKAWVCWNCGAPKYLPDDRVWVWSFDRFFGDVRFETGRVKEVREYRVMN